MKSRTYEEGNRIKNNSHTISRVNTTIGDIRCVNCKTRYEFAPTNICPFCSGELRVMAE